MGERESCGDCSKWEEKKCWTHFQKMRFCVTLVKDFADELAIPKKFANHWKEKLPETVTLKGPNGVTWNVGLVKNGDHLLFKNGWKEFVNNNFLEESDVLVFKYYGDSRFKVFMFDQRSSCEKETLYFIRKCGHIKLDVACQMTEEVRDTSLEAIHATADEGVASGPKKLDVGCQTYENSWDCPPEVTDVGLDYGIGNPSSKKPRIDEYATPMPIVRLIVARPDIKIQKVAHRIESVTPWRTLIKKEPSASTVEENLVISDAALNSIGSGKKGWQYVSNRRLITESEKQTALQLAQASLTNHAEHNSIGSRKKGLQYVSNRRPITESEKQTALQLAQASIVNWESFIVVMQPTHVYKRFYVSIPAEWGNSHLPPKNEVVALRFKESTWRVNLHYREDRRTRGFSSGWKQFAIENNLEEFDVCRFELVSPPGLSIVMNVSFFRVVEKSESY